MRSFFLPSWVLAAFCLIVLATGGRAAGQPAQPSRSVSRPMVEVVHQDQRREQVDLYGGGSYALVIGVSRYHDPGAWSNLSGVSEDVPAVEAALTQQGFEVKVVMDPTCDQLLRELDAFHRTHGVDDAARLIIYFAGHGFTDDKKVGYIVPSDAPSPYKDLKAFRSKAISMEKFRSMSRDLSSRHVLFLFDSCFSGSLFSTRSGPVDLPPVLEHKAVNPVRMFMTSGSETDKVPDYSIFRRAFVRGIGGEGDNNRDGYVTGSELGEFIMTTVLDASREGVGKYSQTPQRGTVRPAEAEEGDFVFVAGRVPTGSSTAGPPGTGNSSPAPQVQTNPTPPSPVGNSGGSFVAKPSDTVWIIWLIGGFLAMLMLVIAILLMTRRRAVNAHEEVHVRAVMPEPPRHVPPAPAAHAYSAPAPAYAPPQPLYTPPAPVAAISNRDGLRSVLALLASQSDPANPVRVWMEKGGNRSAGRRDLGLVPRDNRVDCVVGDRMVLYFQCARPSQVLFVNFGSSGRVQLLAPGLNASPASPTMLPDPAWGVDAFVQTGPAGKQDEIVAVASTDPRMTGYLLAGIDATQPIQYLEDHQLARLSAALHGVNQQGTQGVSIASVSWRVG